MQSLKRPCIKRNSKRQVWNIEIDLPFDFSHKYSRTIIIDIHRNVENKYEPDLKHVKNNHSFAESKWYERKENNRCADCQTEQNLI